MTTHIEMYNIQDLLIVDKSGGMQRQIVAIKKQAQTSLVHCLGFEKEKCASDKPCQALA